MRTAGCQSVFLRTIQEAKNRHNADVIEKFKRVGSCLWRRGGTIYARVRIGGSQTWRSTQTDDVAFAALWLEKFKKERWLQGNGKLREAFEGFCEQCGVVLVAAPRVAICACRRNGLHYRCLRCGRVQRESNFELRYGFRARTCYDCAITRDISRTDRDLKNSGVPKVHKCPHCAKPFPAGQTRKMLCSKCQFLSLFCTWCESPRLESEFNRSSVRCDDCSQIAYDNRENVNAAAYLSKDIGCKANDVPLDLVALKRAITETNRAISKTKQHDNTNQPS